MCKKGAWFVIVRSIKAWFSSVPCGLITQKLNNAQYFILGVDQTWQNEKKYGLWFKTVSFWNK